MNIGAAAELAGMTRKAVRYYESIGLVRPRRDDNDYRRYTDGEVHRLRFLKRARALGFSVQECRLLLSLYDDPSRSSRDVKAIALEKVADIERKLAELADMRDTLLHLAEHCHGDRRPECPILADLAGSSPDCATHPASAETTD